MKKNLNSSNEEVATLDNSNTAVATVDNSKPELIKAELSVDTYNATKEMLSKIQNDEFNHEIEVTAEYLDFDDGMEFKGIFAGFTNISSKFDKSNRAVDGKIKAAKFMGIDEKMYITAAAVVVGTLEEYEIPSAVKILCTGKNSSKNGDYQTFKISILK